MSQKCSQDPKSIGARFRSARSLVPDLNRKSFCERYGINRYTMQSWENGLHVSKGRNVEKFIEALAREGVSCTSEWLIEGLGEPAKPLIGVAKSEPGTPEKFSHIIRVLREEYARRSELLMELKLADDAMAPKFLCDDVVLGCAMGISDKKAINQKYCIVELSPERLVVRKVIVQKDNLLLLPLNDRVPSFTLKLDSQVYLIVYHLINQ